MFAKIFFVGHEFERRADCVRGYWLWVNGYWELGAESEERRVGSGELVRKIQF